MWGCVGFDKWYLRPAGKSWLQAWTTSADFFLKTVFKDYERNVKDFAYLHFSGISSSVLCSLGAEDLLEISVVCSYYGISYIFIFPLATFLGDFHTVPLLTLATPARARPSGLASQGGRSLPRGEPPGQNGALEKAEILAPSHFLPQQNVHQKTRSKSQN